MVVADWHGLQPLCNSNMVKEDERGKEGQKSSFASYVMALGHINLPSAANSVTKSARKTGSFPTAHN